MKNNNVILIKLNDNATLHIRKDKVVATITSNTHGCTDLYVEGVSLPWHIPDDVIPGDALVGLVWEDD